MTMNHQRRRRDILFLVVLASASEGIEKRKGYAILLRTGPLTVLPKIMDQLKAQFPREVDREKELTNVSKLVNGFLPASFKLLRPELKLWIACQVTLRLVATGWRPQPDEAQSAFVQGMYDLSSNMNLANPPGRDLIEFVARSPEVLREKHGLFLSS